MHCCAVLLYRRKDRLLSQLGTPETKLLYTLHWIIIDAIEECADAEAERGIYHSPSHYLFPISSIQVNVIFYVLKIFKFRNRKLYFTKINKSVSLK